MPPPNGAPQSNFLDFLLQPERFSGGGQGFGRTPPGVMQPPGPPGFTPPSGGMPPPPSGFGPQPPVGGSFFGGNAPPLAGDDFIQMLISLLSGSMVQ